MICVKRNLDKVVERTFGDKIIRDSRAQITEVTKLKAEAGVEVKLAKHRNLVKGLFTIAGRINVLLKKCSL